jgi:polysaccharide deacetylase 2 family uncharacterized protein YibQ
VPAGLPARAIYGLVALVALACLAFSFLPAPPDPPSTSEAEEATRARMLQWALRDARRWQEEHGDRRISWDRAEGHLALVIDDVGRELHWHDKLQALPYPLTFSVLPGAVYARGAQERLQSDPRRPREIMLHLPMEPRNGPSMKEGPEAREDFLRLDDPPETLRRKVAAALGRVDDAVGVNNHMGSRLTEDARAMQVVMRELEARDLFFLDSRTTAGTVAEDEARAVGLLAGRRQVFLDHDPTPAAIRAQLEEAAVLSRHEPTVAIAHPSRAVVEVLQAELPRLHAQGIGIFPASRVIMAQQSSHSHVRAPQGG